MSFYLFYHSVHWGIKPPQKHLPLFRQAPSLISKLFKAPFLGNPPYILVFCEPHYVYTIVSMDILFNLMGIHLVMADSFTVGIYLVKVNNRNTRTRWEIWSKLTTKTPEHCHWRCYGVFIVNSDHISHLVLVFLL